MGRGHGGRWLVGALIGALALPFGVASAKDEVEREEVEREESAAEEVDYVELAAKLIADGHYDRAEQMLAGVDDQQENVDRQKLFTLRGIVYLKKQLFSAAAESFEAAIAAGRAEPALQLYLAQAYFGLSEYEKCLRALDAAGRAARELEDAWLMQARSNWELGRHAPSIAALNAGLGRFPSSERIQRTRIFFLVELGLYQEVVAASGPYLARAGVTEDDYVAIGEALRAGGQLRQAQVLLEGARLRFPHSEQIAIQLAHAYLDDRQPAAAAMLFEAAARLDAKYFLESAELYKQANRVHRALSLNARVGDQKVKLKQRLSLLLTQERYEQIAAIEPALSRLDLLADDDIRYALAFAYFNTGQLELAERHARAIAQSEMFDAAVQLRKAIDTCRQAGWECRR